MASAEAGVAEVAATTATAALNRQGFSGGVEGSSSGGGVGERRRGKASAGCS